ncbi:MAG TPA: DUF3576 domain-containing protein [Acidocella sp.]|uniref:DUF3576 domain-containing protein n=1 Tax=Acidocella sp. TaxID=50710 RepID=UPI002BC2AC38|nr:DUF3576 domain-containing protein [Acidocella sp.]HVE20568.1 DUF3576 domain-containing protein [Acidocella sp.]
MRTLKTIAGAAGCIAILALSGCGTTPSANSNIYNPETADLPSQMGQPSDSGSLLTFGRGANNNGSSASQVQVNAYLWRGTLDTLAFMPLVSADPFGGVIITDWYVPPATPNERFKVNAYILSKQLTAGAIKVSVFHQVQQDGQWVDAPPDPTLAGGLEDRILVQAANLQAAAQNNRQ